MKFKPIEWQRIPQNTYLGYAGDVLLFKIKKQHPKLEKSTGVKFILEPMWATKYNSDLFGRKTTWLPDSIKQAKELANELYKLFIDQITESE